MDIAGIWNIYKMDLWDEAYMNMEVQAFIQIHEDGSGNFQFGLVKGNMDGEITENDDGLRYEFSWDGFDECDPANGRGWVARLETEKLEGEIRFHFGDHSRFWASKVR